MLLVELLPLVAPRGGADELGPAATVTGALLGLGLFFVFALAVTLWQVFTRKVDELPTLHVVQGRQGTGVRFFLRRGR